MLKRIELVGLVMLCVFFGSLLVIGTINIWNFGMVLGFFLTVITFPFLFFGTLILLIVVLLYVAVKTWREEKIDNDEVE